VSATASTPVSGTQQSALGTQHPAKGRYALVASDFIKTGGMDRANYALAAYLAGRGDEVHLVAFGAGNDLIKQPSVTFHPVPKSLGSYLLGGPVLHARGRRLAAELAAGGARVLVNGGNCYWGDANWVHHVHASDAPLSGGDLLRRLKTKLAYKVWVREERKAVPMARVVITTCEKNKHDLIERLGVPEGRLRVAYYGIDAGLFRPAGPDERAALRGRLGLPADKPLALFVGALGDRRKGFDTLFEAWKILCDGPGWEPDLIVAGTGAELPLWRARAGAEGLAGRITFLGFRRDVPDIFKACDAHVLPSRYEGYSLVTQEALCCGLPAFITRASGIAERYPPGLNNLVLPDPNDVGDLVDRLRDWQARPDYYLDAVSTFGRDLRSNTWDHMAERVAGFIDESAECRVPSPEC
jgi:glycosyltransferase involved in cell wall biosynthesis